MDAEATVWMCATALLAQIFVVVVAYLSGHEAGENDQREKENNT